MLTEKQKKTLDVYLRNDMNASQTARDLGCNSSTVYQCLKVIEKKGAAPWLSGAPKPDHLGMTKTTVQYDADGKVIQEWRRMSPMLDKMQHVADGLCEQVKGKGKAKARRTRKTDTDEILFEIDLFDAHVGMYADERETLDEDYDCDIASQRMIKAAEGIASRSNRPHKAVLVFGGDMLHSDNRSNKTELSGNVLDVDTRYHRVVSYIIAACRDAVQVAAAIATEVEVVVLEGNHSWHSEVWLARVLDSYYANCPNVTVKLDASPRKKLVFGDNLLVWAHGDKVAANKWAQIIAAEFPKEWGLTKYRHMKCGHIHHQKSIAPVVVDEQAGLLVEYLPALCASDAWHSHAGFIGSQKGACGFEYHKTAGCITRFFNAV